jgi:hypothetical protein
MKINDNGGYKHITTNNENHLINPDKFFSVCVDNFFDNPDLVRNFGLNLPKEPSDIGAWPGVRSQPLHKIDLGLNTSILLKIFSIYFDLRYENVEWGSSSLTFQQVKKYSDDKNNKKNEGWIHQDYDYSMAGVIYLTPNINPDCGTSLFYLKDEEKENFITYTRQYDKHLLYQNEKINDNNYKNSYEKWNNKFIEKTRFQNIYNRMICYDSKEFHKANNYFNEGEDRLTLVYFVNDIKVKKNPLDRIKDKESFDNFMEERIKIIDENIKSTIIKS